MNAPCWILREGFRVEVNFPFQPFVHSYQVFHYLFISFFSALHQFLRTGAFQGTPLTVSSVHDLDVCPMQTVALSVSKASASICMKLFFILFHLFPVSFVFQ